MANNTNKHGLIRDIPLEVKRIVRKRCGYGCILCGAMFCQYHHFDPEYKDAQWHDPNGITLLCAKHHDEITRGRISPDKIIKANQDPYCLKQRHAKYLFENLEHPLEVGIGGLVFITADGVLLKADGEPFLTVKKDEDGIAVLSGSFNTPDGQTLVIENNELVVNTGHWDIESSGTEIVIRSGPGEIVFHLTFTPPHRIQILRIKNYYNGHVIDTEFGKKLYLLSASGASIHFASGFIVIGGGVEFDKKNGIIISGGSLVLGSASEKDFANTSFDHLISQVQRLHELSAMNIENNKT